MAIMNAPLVFLILVSFLTSLVVGPLPQATAEEFYLPVPGVMVQLSPPVAPSILKGIKVHPDNPFHFDFILDRGDSELSGSQLRDESSKLIKYFLASLTIPEKDLWVNLSPYEKKRIIPQSFGLTEMGRDLLGEDYLLKQITATLIYPEDEVGKKFWKRIYEESAKKYGTTHIPVNTFNKVWIVPDKAVVYENAKAGTAYVVESRLKVMLEQDYLSLFHHAIPNAKQGINALGSNIVREVVIPELTKEVNENKNFSKLRQVYNSLILATWYKKKIKDSILAQVYADKQKVEGVGYENRNDVELIYQRYLKAFKKGVYNYIKEEEDPLTEQMIPRKYFSGGFSMAMTGVISINANADMALAALIPEDKAMVVETQVNESTSAKPQEEIPVEHDQVVDTDKVGDEYVGNVREPLTFAVSTFRETGSVEGKSFMNSLLDHVAKPYFAAKGIIYSVTNSGRINDGDPNKSLKKTVKNIGSVLATSSFFPKQRHFGFIISAFLGEQMFNDGYKKILFARDMAPAGTIQEVINQLIPSAANQETGIYYLSRDTLGKYYDEIKEMISSQKLLGLIATEFIQEFTAHFITQGLDLKYFQAIRPSLQREIGRYIELLMRQGITDPGDICDKLFQYDEVKKILINVEKESGQELNPQEEISKNGQSILEAFMSLKFKSTYVKRAIKERYIQKQKIPFMDRLSALIRQKMESDADFRGIVEKILGDFERLGYLGESKLRLIDSGSGTFPLFIQAILRLKRPSIETRSVALGINNQEVMDVLDAKKWNEGIRKLVEGKPILQKYLQYPLQAMESAAKFILQPIVYDRVKKYLKRTQENDHLMSNWIMVNLGLSAIDYYQALVSIAGSADDREKLVGAARHIKTSLGIKTYQDPETGLAITGDEDALMRNTFDDKPPDNNLSGGSTLEPSSLDNMNEFFGLKEAKKETESKFKIWFITAVALAFSTQASNHVRPIQAIPVAKAPIASLGPNIINGNIPSLINGNQQNGPQEVDKISIPGSYHVQIGPETYVYYFDSGSAPLRVNWAEPKFKDGRLNKDHADPASEEELKLAQEAKLKTEVVKSRAMIGLEGIPSETRIPYQFLNETTNHPDRKLSDLFDRMPSKIRENPASTDIKTLKVAPFITWTLADIFANIMIFGNSNNLAHRSAVNTLGLVVGGALVSYFITKAVTSYLQIKDFQKNYDHKHSVRDLVKKYLAFKISEDYTKEKEARERGIERPQKELKEAEEYIRLKFFLDQSASGSESGIDPVAFAINYNGDMIVYWKKPHFKQAVAPWFYSLAHHINSLNVPSKPKPKSKGRRRLRLWVLNPAPLAEGAFLISNAPFNRSSLERNGGIDFTTRNINIQIQNGGGGIKFHLDAAMLKQLQNASGFVPVIINIQPMKDLSRFLGLNDVGSAGSS